MLKAIMEAAERGDWTALRSHVLAVLAENDALHQTLAEQAQALDRLITSVRQVTEIGR